MVNCVKCGGENYSYHCVKCFPQHKTPNLIGITGNARHGKGAVARILADHGYTVLSFAAPVKEFLIKLNPFVQTENTDLGDGQVPYHYGVRLSVLLAHHGTFEVVKEKYPDIRTLMQRIGTDAVKPIFGDDCWVKIGLEKAHDILARGGKVCFDDVRFPKEEGEEILNTSSLPRYTYSCHTRVLSEIWRVTRFNDNGERYDNGIGLSHPSESQVQHFVPDEEIRNDGSLGDLRTKIEKILGVQSLV